MRIREAGAQDAAAVAAFHVMVWRDTYAGIAPPAAFEALDEARRLPGWEARLAPGAGGCTTLIAEDDDGIVGLVSFGAPDIAAYGRHGEIKHLYVHPRTRRTGLGKALFMRARNALALAGFDGTALAVVRGNRAALAFYEALGGRVTGRFTDPGPLWKSDNLLVSWPAPGDETRPDTDPK